MNAQRLTHELVAIARSRRRAAQTAGVPVLERLNAFARSPRGRLTATAGALVAIAWMVRRSGTQSVLAAIYGAAAFLPLVLLLEALTQVFEGFAVHRLYGAER